jgi:hypothetical protein
MIEGLLVLFGAVFAYLAAKSVADVEGRLGGGRFGPWFEPRD